MAHFVAHSDWMFEHSTVHDLHDPQSTITAPNSNESGSTAPSDGVQGILKSLWHQSDMMNCGGSGGLATSQLALLHPSVQGSAAGPSPQAPAVTIKSDALTVTEDGGTVTLPISVSRAVQGDPLLVTITGLASYETLTDGLDQHVFSGKSVTLTADEVGSGLILTSNYTGPDHPVNTLSLTATELMDHHLVTSAAQTITVTDPPPVSGSSTVTGSTGTGSSNPLTLVVTGDSMNGVDPQIQVLVDGQQVGGTYTVTADHASGQTQTITINGNFDPLTAHQVQIQFVNDSWDGTPWWANGTGADGHDINAYVESVSFNGMTMTGVQGTNNATNGVIQAANSHEAVLDINGSLSFSVPADPPAPTNTTVVSGGTSGSGTSTGGAGLVGIGAGPVPSGPGFFVSPNGNDGNPGTIDAPFATLARAQEAMENSSIKATYVEAGTYNLSSTLTLTSADNGETWQYYPANGVDTAVLDGGGNADPIAINSANNITIDGLKVQNFHALGISTSGQNDHITVENCDVGFNNASPGTTAAGISLGGTNLMVKNNYVHDMVSMGISLWAYDAGTSLDGSVVSGNVVLRTVEASSDGGAIYVNMKSTGDAGGHVLITNNFVRDYGSAGNTSANGIYLDDNASNVTVSGNVIGPASTQAGIASSGFFVHNGNNDHIFGNVLDLGASGGEYTVQWGFDSGSITNMSGNTFTNNIVISGFTGNQNTIGWANGVSYVQGGGNPSDYTIQDNVYFNYAGGQVRTDGNLSTDSNPIFENPQISGWSYQITKSSPVFTAPINFSAILGGWGPPGFVIPQTGAVPSSPV
jgi:VCBS repeat-containing protein